MGKKILIVDDEPKLRDMLRKLLEGSDYGVVTAANGREALYTMRQEKPDLIILDVMMPEMDGLDYLRAHSMESNIPVILLTARIENEDKVIGLELGADDYIEKPFNVRELIARVRAILRRENRAQNTLHEVLRAGPISIDQETHVVRFNEKILGLTPTEFELLSALMQSPGRTFSRLDLMEHTAGGAYEGYERTIDVHIRNLRTKIEPSPESPVYVQTVYGYGYRFNPDPDQAIK